MQQYQGRPAIRERKADDAPRQDASNQRNSMYDGERRVAGEPAKFNTRVSQRRIIWENDLYERQSS